jgi:FAD/FMN-containing dehydrogenase
MFAYTILFFLASEALGYSSNWQARVVSRQQQALQDCLLAKSVPTTLNTSSAWSQLTSAYNLRLPYTPVAVTLPTTPQQVSDSVTCAAAAGVKVQPRSGGHSYGSYSLGGKNGSLTVDLQDFNTISLHKG